MFTRVKSAEEIVRLKKSGKILAKILDYVILNTKAGMTGKDISELARNRLKKTGAEPVFLNYEGFPDIICVSVNDEIVHGIPDNKTRLREGDIVSVDFGVNYQGMITDAARTFVVGGQPKGEVKRLLEGTKMALDAGINVLHDGVRVGDISFAIEKVLKQYGLGIVRELVGHGVGHHLHEEPNIPNYGNKGTGPALKKGMSVAIEPMTMLGRESVVVDRDGWTVKTADGSLAAHFEDTVLINEKSSEILTRL